MKTDDVNVVHTQALAAATAWWQNRSFPKTPLGEPYRCSSCGRPIVQREGTSLVGAEMRCDDCTSRHFYVPGDALPIPPGPPVVAPLPTQPSGGTVTGPAPSAPPTGPLPSSAEPPNARRSNADRLRRRTWIVVALAVAAMLILVGGLVLWAPWQSQTTTTQPAAPSASASPLAVTVDSAGNFAALVTPGPNDGAPLDALRRVCAQNQAELRQGLLQAGVPAGQAALVDLHSTEQVTGASGTYALAPGDFVVLNPTEGLCAVGP